MENLKITLSQIGLYNPQRLSDEAAEKLFVVRTKFFQFIIDKLKKEKPNGIPQHYLIIAQRGMGKTTLLKRIEVELRKTEYKEAFIPLLFPEEQYNLKNLAQFWLNSLDALADTLEVEKNIQQVKIIDEKVKGLGLIKNQEDRSKEAFQFLKTICLSINRRPILLIDNMSFIFDRLDKEEQHTLRAWLMQNGAPIVIGASAVTVEDTFDYGAPFYDAFLIQYLKKLSFEELIEILTNLAKLTQAEKVIPTIQQQLARIKTLYHLTGGNPRTATMLFKLIVKGFSKDINDDLEALLDEITPLYKSKFEELSPQMQVIVDAIALNWDPINIEQLRDETHYENNQLSPQLKRLTEVGWIEKTNAYKAKGSAYQISERFFNIWFLMRRSSRRQKRELYCLSKFLESFYGDDINTVAQNSLLSKSLHPNQVTYCLALAEVVKDENLKYQLQEKSYNELQDFAKTNPELLKQFDIPANNEDDLLNLYQQYLNENESGNHLQCEITILKLAELTKENTVLNATIYNELGNLYQIYLKKYKDSEKAYKKAIELDQKYAYPWNGLGNLYKAMQNYIEAEKAYKKAIELDQKAVAPWNGLGNLYKNYMQKYEEAEKAYKKAIELDQKYAYPWNGLGNLYKAMQNYIEAEKAYKKAIELDQKAVAPWNGLGNLYKNYMQKYEEAEKAYKKAIELDQKAAAPWNGLGNLYKAMQNYIEAEKAYKKAIELDQKVAAPWNGLGNLYKAMQNYIEAEKAYKKAIELDQKYAYPWNGLGNLYQDYLQKYEEAEKAYKKAIELDQKTAYPWIGLGDLYQDHLQKYKESEKAYKKAIELDQKDAYPWNGLGNLYQDNMQKYEEAEFVYKKAIELDVDNNISKINLVFLYRDKMSRINDAEEVFNSIVMDETIADSYWLNKALFELYKRNEGIAKEYFEKALETIKDALPQNTQDDWWRFGAIVTKLGFGNWAVSILKEHGFDVVLSPYYVAIKAMNEKDTEGYLNSKALEIREPAIRLIEIMKKY